MTHTDQQPEQRTLRLLVSLHRLIRYLRRASIAAELQPTQLIVLVQLREATSLRIGEIADRVPCSQPTATTVVNALAEAGLVCRAHDTNDGRVIRVVLTEKGHAAVTSLAYSEAEVLTSMLDTLDDAERRLLFQVEPVLRKLTTPLGRGIV